MFLTTFNFEHVSRFLRKRKHEKCPRDPRAKGKYQLWVVREGTFAAAGVREMKNAIFYKIRPVVGANLGGAIVLPAGVSCTVPPSHYETRDVLALCWLASGDMRRCRASLASTWSQVRLRVASETLFAAAGERETLSSYFQKSCHKSGRHGNLAVVAAPWTFSALERRESPRARPGHGRGHHPRVT